MNKKTLKTLATGAAITLATVGASTVSADTQYGIQLNRVTGEWQTVNNATGEIVKSVPNETYSSYEEAEASLMTSTVEAPVTTETPVTETNTVEAPKTAADVKSEVDAQQTVVDATATEASQAQAEVNTANQEVSNAQSAVDTATQAVADAEANAAKATPENIAANQSDQTANLADQTANAAETDEVNAEIASQSQAVADAQTAVDTAQAEKDQADSAVASKEADVKAAQDALSGTGLAEAQATLDQATADVKTAQDNVATATTAVDTAKKADADRQTKIDAATTDVAVKTDAVDTAKAKLTTAQDTVKTTTEAVNKATDAVKSATDALANVDTVTIADLTQFKDDKASGDSDFMTDSGATAIEQSSTKIGEADKAKIVDFTNITKEQAEELALYNLQVINAIRQRLGLPAFELNTGSMKAAQDQMDKYVARNQDILTAGHLPGDYFGENGGPIALAKFGTSMTMYDVKQEIYKFVMAQAFADAPSNWGHSNNIQKQVSDFGASFGIIAGELYSINVFGIYTGTPNHQPK
ncbi:TPA: SEC10/PgrA surface exclusion domain-containing protein [Streptococcus suis]